MQEDVVKYQIGGPNQDVQTDEIDIGGKGSEKQKILTLLEINTDGNPAYNFLEKSLNFSLIKVAHWEENHQHVHLKELNMIGGNLKNWYRGIFSHFETKNVSYYLNEFAYRFNRRRSESSIFDRLLTRSIVRCQKVTYQELISNQKYYPMAA